MSDSKRIPYKPFYAIPKHELTSISSLGPAFSLYAALQSRRNTNCRDCRTFPTTTRELCELTGLSERTVFRQLSFLKGRKVVVISEEVENRHGNVYLLPDPRFIGKTDDKDDSKDCHEQQSELPSVAVESPTNPYHDRAGDDPLRDASRNTSKIGDGDPQLQKKIRESQRREIERTRRLIEERTGKR